MLSAREVCELLPLFGHRPAILRVIRKCAVLTACSSVCLQSGPRTLRKACEDRLIQYSHLLLHEPRPLHGGVLWWKNIHAHCIVGNRSSSCRPSSQVWAPSTVKQLVGGVFAIRMLNMSDAFFGCFVRGRPSSAHFCPCVLHKRSAQPATRFATLRHIPTLLPN